MSADMDNVKESILQMTSMDRAYIDEYDVVQRYIRHTLSETELAQFEVYILSNPSVIAEIEQQRLLNQIFREELPKANRAAAASQGLLHRFRHAVPLAACLLLALYVGLNTGNRTNPGPQAVPTLDTVVLQDLRGVAGAVSLSLPASGENISQANLPLKIDVGPQLEPLVTYSVSLHAGESGDGAPLVQVENQKATADGWLELTVALPAVSPALYQVVVVELPRGDSRTYALSVQ